MMLEEGRHQFDVIDSTSDLGPYKVVILPDTIPVSPDLAERLECYIRDGGAVMASHRSGLAPDGTHFASCRFGVRR